MCPFDGIPLIPMGVDGPSDSGPATGSASGSASILIDSPGHDVAATIPDGFIRPENLHRVARDVASTLEGPPPASLLSMLAAGDVRTGMEAQSPSADGDFVSLRDMPSTTAAMRAMAIDESASPYQHMVGMTLDQRYTIEQILGEGGMGVVFLAQHNMLEKPVAIKVLKPEVAHNEEVTTRFLREARAASSIGHPNIVEFTDFGTTPDGLTYSVMEYVEGPTLDRILEAEGPLAVDRAIDVARKLADSLSAAHHRSIVHRDLKPENVFLYDHEGTRDQVKIVDFGIAKILEMGRAAQVPSITADGTVFGTPEYMAPEQASGRPDIDHRVDVYSLGIILYEMLTRVVPHKTNNGLRTLAMRMLDPVKPMGEVRPDLSFSPDLEALVATALATDPARRLPSMDHFLARLDELSGGPGVGGAGHHSSPALAVPHSSPGLTVPHSSPGLAVPGNYGPGGESFDQMATTPYLGHVDDLLGAYPKVRQSQPAIGVPDSTGQPAPESVPRGRRALAVLALLVAALAGGLVGFLIFGGRDGGEKRTDKPEPALAPALDASPAARQPAPGDAGMVGPRSSEPDSATDSASVRDQERGGRSTQTNSARTVRRPTAKTPGDDERAAGNSSSNSSSNSSGDSSVRSSGQSEPVPADAGTRQASSGRPISVTVLAQPDHASLYVKHNYSGKGGTTFQRPEGTVITVECRLKGYEAGRVTVRFDGQKDAYLCQAKRVPQCVNGLKNPFDKCPD